MIRKNYFEWGNPEKAHSDKADTFTLKPLQKEGVSRSTLYRILRRKEDGIPAERQCGSRRPAKIMTKSGIKQLDRLFDHNCSL